ncbi:MAG: hypothetical protein RMJ44_12380, partial [Cytophagales bacterium]|nr:hypothetical protein [Cytophagales bacterium]
MNHLFYLLIFLLFISTLAKAQGRINFGNAFLVFSGNGIYLNIDNSNANAVLRPGTGHAISSNEFQR